MNAANNKGQLVLRQVQDIQIQAEKLIRMRRLDDSIEDLKRYSDELALAINNYTNSEMILERLDRVPKLEYYEAKSVVKKGFAAWLLGWAGSAVAQYQNEERLKQELGELRSIYGSIEFLLKAEME